MTTPFRPILIIAVLYFFKQFPLRKALTLETNINDFRDDIKYMFLSESENVQHICPVTDITASL